MKAGKSPWLALAPIATVSLVLALVIGPWSRTVNLMDTRLSILCHVNALIWLVVLWWATHHLVFQLASLFRKPGTFPPDGQPKVRFVLAYLTCDDFQEYACLSCIRQQYPRKQFRVLICDDSQDAASKTAVSRFGVHHKVQVVTRGDRKGFKAGNINNAVSLFTSAADEWIVVVDADQILPSDYLDRMAAAIRDQPPEVAFVQGSHCSDHTLSSPAGGEPRARPSRFQDALGNEIDIFYERSLPMRDSFGFLPFIGHGAALRRSTLIRLRLPEVVSEDYAFSLRLRAAGERGAYAESIFSWESFPKDFGALMARLGKFAGGSAELLRRGGAGGFLLSRRVFLSEKADFLMLLLWYPLCSFALANMYLSGYVCHRLWTDSNKIPFLHPVLAYLFILMLVLSIPVMVSSTRGILDVTRYWFWSMAVYAAALPNTACHFLVHVRRAPTFTTTPKGLGRAPSLFWHGTAMVPLGIVTLILSKLWYSPFSFILASYGAAFVSFPLYFRLAEESILGRLARLAIWIPGAFSLIGTYAMWTRGKF